MVIMTDCCWAAPSAPDGWSALYLHCTCSVVLQGSKRLTRALLKDMVGHHC